MADNNNDDNNYDNNDNNNNDDDDDYGDDDDSNMMVVIGEKEEIGPHCSMTSGDFDAIIGCIDYKSAPFKGVFDLICILSQPDKMANLLLVLSAKMDKAAVERLVFVLGSRGFLMWHDNLFMHMLQEMMLSLNKEIPAVAGNYAMLYVGNRQGPDHFTECLKTLETNMAGYRRIRDALLTSDYLYNSCIRVRTGGQFCVSTRLCFDTEDEEKSLNCWLNNSVEARRDECVNLRLALSPVKNPVITSYDIALEFSEFLAKMPRYQIVLLHRKNGSEWDGPHTLYF